MVDKNTENDEPYAFTMRDLHLIRLASEAIAANPLLIEEIRRNWHDKTGGTFDGETGDFKRIATLVYAAANHLAFDGSYTQ